jgi:hypothetical protein
MRRLAWVLTLVVVTALPRQALADSHQPAAQLQHSSSCGVRLNEDDAGSLRGLHCTTGVAVKVYGNGMQVRPYRGSVLQVRFTEATEFTTDSGEGVLDGLVVRDYVCVAYVPHVRTVTALLVMFNPKSVPCRTHS